MVWCNSSDGSSPSDKVGGGGGEGCHLDPEIRGKGSGLKNGFGPLGPQFIWSKDKKAEGAEGLADPPLNSLSIASNGGL